MMKPLLLPLLVLAGCTGQNVDENFVAAHGALLARVECKSRPSGSLYDAFDYDALMFLDGSVLASFVGHISGAGTPTSGSAFYERSDAERTHAAIRFRPGPYCSGAWYGDRYTIIGGELKWLKMDTSPPCSDFSPNATLDLETDCTGFNKSLFD